MTQQSTYGPHSPHPLSQVRTELIWEGKYDEYGNRREVDIAGCAMPFAPAFRLRLQKIDSIDEPVCSVHFSGHLAAMGQWSLFEQQNSRVDDFRNRLFACVAQPFWGDNKLVMHRCCKSLRARWI